MKAERIAYIKEKFGDDRIIEIAIWQVPKDKDRPHGYKYRLHYGYTDGTCITRYDNEKGKGNHRHIGDKEDRILLSLLESYMKILKPMYKAI